MKPPHLAGQPLDRRTFLRVAGIALSLPWLEAMIPAGFAATRPGARSPRRMLFINRGLGLYGPNFFPTQTGAGYELSSYLRELADFREDFTVCSGLSHPDSSGGHATETTILTCAPHAGAAGFRNTVSLDQFAAEHVADATRFPSIVLGSHQGSSLSWARNGTPVPAFSDPTKVFRQLFITGTPEEIRQQEQAQRDGHSILDYVSGQTAALQRKVGAGDRDRLDQYFTAVRETEKRMQSAEAWSHTPKPKVAVPPLGPYPDASDIVGRSRMMFDLMHLAVQTDSTRLMTFFIDTNGGGPPPIPGVAEARHPLSHHGQEPTKIKQLQAIEREELKCLREFLAKLKSSREAGDTLLDHTTVFYGSNLGNASSHDTRNLPVLLAGGGFKHGQHLAFDRVNNAPLANLFVSMLQDFGLPVEKFGSSTGVLRGLDRA